MDLQQRLEQAVIHAVGNLLDTMIPLRFERAAVRVEPVDVPPHLMGTIGVQGRLEGSISISMPIPLAQDMTALMLDEPVESVTDDVYETMAEMANMIAGSVKTYLSHQDEIFHLGLPQVLELAHQTGQESHHLAIPIDTEKGRFVVLSSLLETDSDVCS